MVPGPVALSRLDLACEPSSIRSARRHARDTLERWAVPDEVLCDALVIVSELATNAVRHTAPPIPSAVPGGGQPKAHRYSLTLWTAGLRLYIAVRDENPAPPVLRAAPDYAERGRRTTRARPAYRWTCCRRGWPASTTGTSSRAR